MNINYKKIAGFVLSLGFLFVLPLFITFAAVGPGAATIQNPLGAGNDSVQALLLKIMNLVATVGAIIVVFFIILSGYKFVTAGDSDSDRTKARDMFYSTIIGGVILLGADIIANVVVKTVSTTVGRTI